MNKEKYISELKKYLRKLPSDDIKKYLDFYREIIDDRIEEGLSEEDATLALGSPETLAKQIFAEAGLDPKEATKRRLKTWELIFLICGSPIWVSLLAAFFAVILALFVVLWAVDICLWAADLCFAAGGFAGIASGIALMATGHFPQGLFMLGCGFICVGLGIFWFFLCHITSNGIVKLSKILFKLPGKIIKGKEIKQ